MSFRWHPTKNNGKPESSYGHWQITVEHKGPHKKTGKIVRKQRSVDFEGSRSEAAVADAELNNRPSAMPYPTVLEIVPRFLASYQNNTQPNSYAAMNRALDHLLPYYGSMRIPLITDHQHEMYKSMRLAATYLPGKHGQKIEDDAEGETEKRRSMSKNSINRELVCLNSLLTYAEEVEKVQLGARPKTFNRKQAAGKKIVPLAPTEMEELLKVIPANDSRLVPVCLMMIGGLRRTEAASVTVEKVMLKNNCINVVGKGGDEQTIVIMDRLRSVVEPAIGERTSGLLAVNPKTKQPFGNISKSLKAYAKKAGITREISHHTLRHSCATALIIAGYSLPFVQSYLRHVDPKTSMIYVHIAATFVDIREKKAAMRLFPQPEMVQEQKEEREISYIMEDLKVSKYADSYERAHHS